jgi:hypothetical protein
MTDQTKAEFWGTAKMARDLALAQDAQSVRILAAMSDKEAYNLRCLANGLSPELAAEFREEADAWEQCAVTGHLKVSAILRGRGAL